MWKCFIGFFREGGSVAYDTAFWNGKVAELGDWLDLATRCCDNVMSDSQVKTEQSVDTFGVREA